MKKVLFILSFFVSLAVFSQNPAGGSHLNVNFIQGRKKLDSIPIVPLDTNATKILAKRVSDSLMVQVPWPAFGGVSIGGNVVGGTTGSVIFIGTSGQLQQINAQFFYDSTNNRLGLGSNVPLSRLYLQTNNLTTTSPTTSGLFLDNTTAGTNGTQLQNSPVIVLQGHEWSGAVDSAVSYTIQYVPATHGGSIMNGYLQFTPVTAAHAYNPILMNQAGQMMIGESAPIFNSRDLELFDANNPQLRLTQGTGGGLSYYEFQSTLASGQGILQLRTNSATPTFDIGNVAANPSQINVNGNIGSGGYFAFNSVLSGTKQMAILVSDLGVYAAGRTVSIYDYTLTKERWGIDASGNMWLGSASTAGNYTLEVQQLNAVQAVSNVSTIVNSNGYWGVGDASQKGLFSFLMPASGLQLGASYVNKAAFFNAGGSNSLLVDAFTANSGTLTEGAMVRFGIDSIGATHTSVTHTTEATLIIDGAPVTSVTSPNSNSVTITNAYALLVKGGTSAFGGVVLPTSTIAIDLGSSTLSWRDLYFSHPIGETAIGASSSLGTNVTSLTPSGNDVDFQIVVVSSGNVSGTVGIVNFGRTWGATPKCTFSPADQTTAIAFASTSNYFVGTATSASNWQATASWTGAQTYKWNCHCAQ